MPFPNTFMYLSLHLSNPYLFTCTVCVNTSDADAASLRLNIWTSERRCSSRKQSGCGSAGVWRGHQHTNNVCVFTLWKAIQMQSGRKHSSTQWVLSRFRSPSTIFSYISKPNPASRYWAAELWTWSRATFPHMSRLKRPKRRLHRQILPELPIYVREISSHTLPETQSKTLWTNTPVRASRWASFLLSYFSYFSSGCRQSHWPLDSRITRNVTNRLRNMFFCWMETQEAEMERSSQRSSGCGGCDSTQMD